MSKKSVGIIGAGVSGLVAAVNMLKVDLQPIVFDKAEDLGGMWNPKLRPCWNTMRVNISKFSTALADFSWSKEAPLFPNQEQVHEYLLNYSRENLSDKIFRFNCQVIRVDYVDHQWTVEYRTKTNEILSEKFHFLIVASGFFDSPYLPMNITGVSSFRGQLLHSCDYRSSEQIRNRRVIIVGGSMSAAEIAADMAKHAQHIIHIVPHCFWSLPRFRPLIPTDPATPFLPGDLVSFRRSTRMFKEESVLLTNDDRRAINQRLRLVTGDSEKSSKLIIDVDDKSPAYIAVSDLYAEWSRSEKIDLVCGRLVEINDEGT